MINSEILQAERREDFQFRNHLTQTEFPQHSHQTPEEGVTFTDMEMMMLYLRLHRDV
jgi:hypothetical protein